MKNTYRRIINPGRYCIKDLRLLVFMVINLILISKYKVFIR